MYIYIYIWFKDMCGVASSRRLGGFRADASGRAAPRRGVLRRLLLLVVVVVVVVVVVIYYNSLLTLVLIRHLLSTLVWDVLGALVISLHCMSLFSLI